MKIGDVFRYSRPYSAEPVRIGSFVNYFHATLTQGCKLPLLDSGINPIAAVTARDGIRVPAILISSSPHRVGTKQTPWQDIFDVDNGHIRYYGDNKTPGSDPSLAEGNRALLSAFQAHDLGFGVW